MSKLGRRLARLNKKIAMPPEVRVLIGTPAQDTVLANNAHSIVRMVQISMANGIAVNYEVVQSSILVDSRRVLAQMTLDHGFTHLLFVDSDMQFAPDILVRLLAHGVPIVGANCMSRRPPFKLTGVTEDGESLATDRDAHGLVKVIRVGFGVMLIDAEVFRKLSVPWFHFVYMGGEVKDWPEHIQKPDWLGEDYFFCVKARQEGFPIFVDQDVSRDVQHLGLFAYSPLLYGTLKPLPTSPAESEVDKQVGIE